MGNLYLVRHGQASFGADDYDQLSARGHQQSVRLGAYFAQQGLRFDALITGTLKRLSFCSSGSRLSEPTYS
jgi:broad specificity phosphatase PhoE